VLLVPLDVEKVTGTRFVRMDGVPYITNAEQPIIINQLIKPGTILSQREIQHAKYQLKRVLLVQMVDVEKITGTRFVRLDGVPI